MAILVFPPRKPATGRLQSTLQSTSCCQEQQKSYLDGQHDAPGVADILQAAACVIERIHAGQALALTLCNEAVQVHQRCPIILSLPVKETPKSTSLANNFAS